jgi:hypothetical protein
MSVSSVRRDLYLTQRAIGTAQAASRSPKALSKRLVRRHVTRALLKPYGRAWAKI